MNRARSRLFEELIAKSWWSILFFLLCYFAYDQALAHRKREEVRLRKKLESLTLQKEIAKERQEELKLQIASQNDPEWIEMTLKKELGLVPEGEKKVHFISK